MRHSITIILFLFLSNYVFSQEFGCFDVNSNSNADGVYVKEHLTTRSYFNFDIDWEIFSVDSNCSDGYYKEYVFNNYICSKVLKMEGEIKNGRKEGPWTLCIDHHIYLKGNYINGSKEGLWIVSDINLKKDTVLMLEIEFTKDKYNGYIRHYYPSSQLYKTIGYKNGLKDGQEIKYFENDTTDILIIEEINEYKNDKLDGKSLKYSDLRQQDTAFFGTYSFGKRNGRFLINYNGKLIVDYVEDQVNGEFIKFNRNGVLLYEIIYRNNLPYNLLQVNDTAGKLIESNTLINGNGTLNWYYPNGKLFSSFEYKNQLISGKFYRYYQTGKIMEEGLLYTSNEKSYRKKRPIEQCEDLNLFSAWQLNHTKGTNYKIYNEDGSLRSIACSSYCDSLDLEIVNYDNFNNGKLISKETNLYGLQFGLSKSYYENDSLKMEGNYKIINIDTTKTSVKDGIFKYYHANGKIKAEVNYSNNEETGSSFFYDDSGSLKRIKVLESNGGIYNLFNQDTCNRIDEKGRKQGKWISFGYFYLEDNCNDIPNQIKYYKDDLPIGTWEFFSNDGKMLTERIVWQDSVNSYYQRWGFNGKLREEGYMINEIRNGEWKEYDFKKGYLKNKGQYFCGEKNGIWLLFERNGKIKGEFEFINGQKVNSL